MTQPPISETPRQLRGKRKFIPVIIENEQTGAPEVWHLLEMNTAGQEQYQNFIQTNGKTDLDGKFVGFSKVDGLAMIVAGQNLVDPKNNNSPMSPARFMFQLPHETIDELVDMAMELNGKKKSKDENSVPNAAPNSASPSVSAKPTPKS